MKSMQSLWMFLRVAGGGALGGTSAYGLMGLPNSVLGYVLGVVCVSLYGLLGAFAFMEATGACGAQRLTVSAHNHNPKGPPGPIFGFSMPRILEKLQVTVTLWGLMALLACCVEWPMVRWVVATGTVISLAWPVLMTRKETGATATLRTAG